MTSALPRFEALLEAHHDEIYSYLWRLLDGAARPDAAVDAQDLTQDTFARAYRAYPRLRAGSNPRAWLYKIASNCAYSHLRRKGVALPLDGEIDDPPSPPELQPERQVMFSQSLEAIREAADCLPPKQRSALVMRYVQELDYDEIAEALDCSPDSARAHVYQALKRLRMMLREENHED